MAHAVLYKYINCRIEKLLALALMTNYITNLYNNNIRILIFSFSCKPLKIYPFQGLIYQYNVGGGSHINLLFSFATGDLVLLRVHQTRGLRQ